MVDKLFVTKAFIRTLNPLAANKNRNGERGSPCLRPLSMENSSVGHPLTSIEADAVPTHSFIHLRQRVGKFMFYITTFK